MANDFKEPDFSNGELNISVQDGEVRIYGTNEGIKRLMSLCKDLIDNPKQGHVHLEDYELLAKESLKGVIALFPEGKK